MREPIWIDANALRLLQVESLAEFGGLPGMRDALKDTASHKNLFLSALARPQNLFAYEEVTNISRLGAAYAYGLARNHSFNDGNKRVAFLAIGMFLAINGFLLKVEPTEAVNTMLALATGDLTELDLASWIEKFILKDTLRYRQSLSVVLVDS
jgi:death-on-curing protein